MADENTDFYTEQVGDVTIERLDEYGDIQLHVNTGGHGFKTAMLTWDETYDLINYLAGAIGEAAPFPKEER